MPKIYSIVLFKYLTLRSSNSKDSADEAPHSEQEEGEIAEEDVAHPMVQLTKIDPKDIPDVSNKFLMRGANPKNGDRDDDGSDADKDGKEKDGKKDRDGRRKDRDVKEGRNKY